MSKPVGRGEKWRKHKKFGRFIKFFTKIQKRESMRLFGTWGLKHVKDKKHVNQSFQNRVFHAETIELYKESREYIEIKQYYYFKSIL